MLADDNLKLLACPLDAEGAGESVELISVDEALVLDVEAETGDAVRREGDIVFTANELNDTLNEFVVLAFCCHVLLLILERLGGTISSRAVRASHGLRGYMRLEAVEMEHEVEDLVVAKGESKDAS